VTDSAVTQDNTFAVSIGPYISFCSAFHILRASSKWDEGYSVHARITYRRVAELVGDVVGDIQDTTGLSREDNQKPGQRLHADVQITYNDVTYITEITDK